MWLNYSYVISILGKNSLTFIEKCISVLNFTETRLKLFSILGKSEAGVLINSYKKCSSDKKKIRLVDRESFFYQNENND